MQKLHGSNASSDANLTPTTVAVMQPYLYPYAGYFRLLTDAHVFVILDCVQFPRRGRVHRADLDGEGSWLTLPLAAAPRETRIRDMRFADRAPLLWGERLQRVPRLREARGEVAEAVREHLYGPLDDLVEFLERGLRLVARELRAHPRIVRSSSLELDPRLRGQDRILEIAGQLGASRYLNAPGGRALYDASAFAARGMELHFLPPFPGSGRSILSDLLERG